MLKKRIVCLAMCGVMVFTAAGCTKSGETKKTEESVKAEESKKFEPSLDTEAPEELEIAGFMANFEALDQVINDFNEIYPNVSVNYEQNGMNGLKSYLDNNTYVDIFMTADGNVRDQSNTDLWVADKCQDLSEIDTSDIDPDLVEACTIDGKLVRLPSAITMCGMVVNETLLENEGLEVPENYQELMDVCAALKEKGYTPIQSAQNHAYSDLVLPMGMTVLGSDEELCDKVKSGDTSFVDSLQPLYEHLEEMITKGYIDYDLNGQYPEDNYDGAILKFFEGDVPFWIATTENFSGMKKRESKSEAFTAEPFTYEFISAPMGEDGSYVYEEPWYGFSVNKDSEQLDYAMEFVRFLAQEEELNKIASVKGMPSVTINTEDSRFENALHPQKSEGRYVNNGEMGSKINSLIADTANQMGNGKLKSAKEALKQIRENS